jgi:cyclopropane fatty-acyl-phospholipid synthase-like methyltransferase
MDTRMAEELTYKNEAAAGYDRAFARVTTHFVPFLLRAAHITPGMRVLDIATGTGLAAEAALHVVGPTATSLPPTFRPQWSRRRAGASAKQKMRRSWSRMGRRFHFRMEALMG